METSRTITKNNAIKIIDNKLKIYNLSFYEIKNLINQDEKARIN